MFMTRLCRVYMAVHINSGSLPPTDSIADPEHLFHVIKDLSLAFVQALP